MFACQACYGFGMSSCKRCGGEIERRPGRPAPWCITCGAVLRGRDRAMYRRALKYDPNAELIVSLEVFERDNWVCQLCHDPIPVESRDINEMHLGKYDPNAPVVEHTVALSVGGKHCMGNVVAAHQNCNSRKHIKASMPQASVSTPELGEPCIQDGCERAGKKYQRGWCHTHYYANKQYGDPLLAACGCGCGTIFQTSPNRGKWAAVMPGHNVRWGNAQTLDEQLATKTVSQPVSARGSANGLVDDCLLWTVKIGPRGYGDIAVYVDGQKVRGRVHRVVYAAHHGLELSDLRGQVVDHLCGVRACCNVNHLELVTHQENLARKGEAVTACPNGHPYTPENMRGGRKQCRQCTRNETHVPKFGHEFIADPDFTSTKKARCLVCHQGRGVKHTA